MKNNPRAVMFISSLLAVYTSINFYIGWHITTWFNAVGISYEPVIFWVIFGIIVYGYIAGRIPLPAILKPIGRFIKVMGSYYVFVFEMGFIILLFVDVIGLITYLSVASMEAYVIYAGSASITALVIMFIVGSWNAWNPIVRKFEVEVNKKISASQKKWVVAVASDIHLGNVVGNKHLKRLITRVNAMNPDLILLPGDVIDDSLEPFMRNNMSKTLGKLSSKNGIYAVLGNHEYYGGHTEQYITEMDKIGIQVLRDEWVEIAGDIYVVGRKDKTAESLGPNGRLNVQELVDSLDRTKPIILMDHQPTKFSLAAEAGADIMLSGHTHRGQFLPNHLFTKRLFELDWGYMKKHAMHVIVSSGFGSWGPPIRIGSRSEIIRLEIKFQS